MDAAVYGTGYGRCPLFETASGVAKMVGGVEVASVQLGAICTKNPTITTRLRAATAIRFDRISCLLAARTGADQKPISSNLAFGRRSARAFAALHRNLDAPSPRDIFAYV
jgi:hypothetical protein